LLGTYRPRQGPRLVFQFLSCFSVSIFNIFFFMRLIREYFRFILSIGGILATFSPALQLFGPILKGQCHEIFYLWFFFFKQLHLAPVDKPSNDFNFFRIFAEIFDYFGASPVSTTPAMHALPVSLTPVNVLLVFYWIIKICLVFWQIFLRHA
jgi:hypothetical protein